MITAPLTRIPNNIVNTRPSAIQHSERPRPRYKNSNMTAKSHLALAALLFAQGISAFPKPLTSLQYYEELPLCAVRLAVQQDHTWTILADDAAANMHDPMGCEVGVRRNGYSLPVLRAGIRYRPCVLHPGVLRRG